MKRSPRLPPFVTAAVAAADFAVSSLLLPQAATSSLPLSQATLPWSDRYTVLLSSPLLTSYFLSAPVLSYPSLACSILFSPLLSLVKRNEVLNLYFFFLFFFSRVSKGLSLRDKGIQGTQTYRSANPQEFQTLDWPSHSTSGR